MAQPSLFDAVSTAGAVRATDPDSSRHGARRANVNGQRETIIRALCAHEAGLTADELMRFLPGVSREQVCSRLALLRKDGRVESFGVRSNGRVDVQVWHAVRAGVVTVRVTGGRL